MSYQFHFDLHQSQPGTPMPGCWKLDAGRALTLRPREAGVLRIAHGRVWVTSDAPRIGPGNESGDFFLEPGKGLVVQAGQQLVIESAGVQSASSAYFSWDPLPQAQAQSVSDAAVQRASRWQSGVAQPMRDLGLALGQAGAAFGRLVVGLLGLGEYLVAGRGRVLPRLESNQP